ncbi:hypothetical protein TNCV_1420631 [Trichonephila clavipes]|nr:hypothetical protein TNCV_1420631 [Trichonephila clavipes]
MSIDPIPKLPLSITIESSLMNMLTKAMTSDVDPNKARLTDTVKVNFGTRAASTDTTAAMPWKVWLLKASS